MVWVFLKWDATDSWYNAYARDVILYLFNWPIGYESQVVFYSIDLEVSSRNLTSLNEAGQQDVKRNRRQRNNPLDIYLINTLVSVNQFDKNLSSSALVTVEERGKLWAHKCTFHRHPGWPLILWLDVTKVTKSDSIRIFCRTIVEGKKSRPRSFFNVDYV